MNAHLTETLGLYFEKHGKNIYGSPSPLNSSPLYANLSLHIAADPEILLLVAEADRTTTITNLLFGTVHFLLLSGVQHPLSKFYPDLTPDPHPLADAYPSFREFCLEHADEIRQLVQLGGNSAGWCDRMKGEKETEEKLTCPIHKQACFT